MRIRRAASVEASEDPGELERRMAFQALMVHVAHLLATEYIGEATSPEPRQRPKTRRRGGDRESSHLREIQFRESTA
jgi:hypothetical protein